MWQNKYSRFINWMCDRMSVYIRMMNMFIDKKMVNFSLFEFGVRRLCMQSSKMCLIRLKSFYFCIFRVLYKRFREIDYICWLPISYSDRILSNNIIVDSKNSHNKSIYMKKKIVYCIQITKKLNISGIWIWNSCA